MDKQPERTGPKLSLKAPCHDALFAALLEVVKIDQQ
jgi:hypothetical protein